MKKYFQNLLILISFLFLTAATSKQKITSLQLYNLKGKVKMLVIIFDSKERAFNDTTFFSPTGMAEKTLSHMKGKFLDLNYETSFEYDDEGFLKKENGKNLREGTTSTIDYTKTHKGKTTILSFNVTDKDFVFKKQKFIANGRLVKEITETSDQTSISRLHYDKNNTHTSTTTTYIPVKKDKRKSTSTTTYSYKEFDEQGNWITIEAITNDGEPQITKRIIEYY